MAGAAAQGLLGACCPITRFCSWRRWARRLKVFGQLPAPGGRIGVPQSPERLGVFGELAI
jgi:hypothetical protein